MKNNISAILSIYIALKMYILVLLFRNEVLFLSNELQIGIVFGICVLLLVISYIFYISSSFHRKYCLIAAVFYIIALFSFLFYIAFSYRQSSSIICGIVDHYLECFQTIDNFLRFLKRVICYTVLVLMPFIVLRVAIAIYGYIIYRKK